MNICFVTAGIITKHATMKRAFGMARPLVELGHTVTLILQDAEDNREQAKLCGAQHVKYFPTSSWLEELRFKRNAIMGCDYDIVHVCGLGFRNFIPRIAKQKFYLVMDHVELESSIPSFPWYRRLFQRTIEWLSLINFDATVTASSYLQNLFSSRLKAFGIKRPDILWIPYAFDGDQNELTKSSTFLVDKFPEKKTLLYAGGLYRDYGWPLLLDATEQIVRESIPDFMLVLAGANGEEQEIRQQIAQRGLEKYVSLEGYVKPPLLYSYLKSATMLVAPLKNTIADKARCPGKLFLYLAAGRPIITADVGDAKTYVGKQGVYYTPENRQSFIAACQKAVTQNTSYTLEEVMQSHSWNARVDAWLAWAKTLPVKNV